MCLRIVLKSLINRRGQSIIEVLIAISIGVLMIVGSIAIISAAIRINRGVGDIQVASSLAKELFENVRVVSGRDWHSVDTLATTSANAFYVVASTSPFTVASGTETLTVATSSYTRNFYLDDVYRNSGGNIDTSGTIFDPSTKKLTVKYTWPQSNIATIEGYITRSRNVSFIQTDWSSGAGQEGPLTSTSSNSRFASSSAIDFTTTTGSVVIEGI